MVVVKRGVMRFSCLSRGLIAAVTAGMSISATALFATAANAYTMTSLLSATDCNISCSVVHNGQGAVTDNGTGTLAFQITLFDNYQFVGGADAFAFNLTNSPSITFSNFTPIPTSDPFTGSNTTSEQFQMNGFGPFMYGVTAPGSGPDGQSLNFDVDTTGGLTLSDLIFGNTFAAHLCPVTATGCDPSDDNQTDYAFTFIGRGFTPAETPVPAALPLFASVLGGGYLLSKLRRKRKRRNGGTDAVI